MEILEWGIHSTFEVPDAVRGLLRRWWFLRGGAGTLSSTDGLDVLQLRQAARESPLRSEFGGG